MSQVKSLTEAADNSKDFVVHASKDPSCIHEQPDWQSRSRFHTAKTTAHATKPVSEVPPIRHVHPNKLITTVQGRMESIQAYKHAAT